AGRIQRSLAVPEVLHHRPIDDLLAVEPHRGPLADLQDAQLVPLAERTIRERQREARVPFAVPRALVVVVPQAAAALVRAELPLPAGLGRVPDLHLGCAAQIDAGVGAG